MSFLKTLGLTTLTLFVALALNADPAMAKPKHKANKHHNKHQKNHHEQDYDNDHYAKGHGKGHGKYNCDRPYGLRKQGKMPPGWVKKCGGTPHAYDRSNQDPGYHEPERSHDRHASKTNPCTASGKAKDIAVGASMGTVLGGVIGSGTGDTEMGAIFGGVVGGIIGATAGDGNRSSSQPKC